jgi:hypothetical protein
MGFIGQPNLFCPISSSFNRSQNALGSGKFTLDASDRNTALTTAEECAQIAVPGRFQHDARTVI